MSKATLSTWASLLTVGGALLAAMGATAQVQPPRELPPGIIPAPRTVTPPPGVTALDGDVADMERRYEEDQERLRRQQADPELRQRDFETRLQALRAASPDFARVLDIDAATEETLLKLLVDEEIAKQFAPNPFTGLGPRGFAVRAAQSAARVQQEALAQLQEQRFAPLRSRFALLRTELAIGADEELPLDTPELQLESQASSGNTELQVQVRINGKEVTKTLKSRGGRSVTFTGPEALTVEVLPALTAPNTLKVEIKRVDRDSCENQPQVSWCLRLRLCG